MNETMQELYRADLLRMRLTDCGAAADEGGVCDRRARPHIHLSEDEEVMMKVVVLDRPKVLSFFLRKIYGIKKVKEKEGI